MPATQVGVAWSGGVHVVSHVPQCAVLLVKSTQEPSQLVVLPLHVVVHLPPRHTWVPVQGLPHVPQFAPSDVRSTHAPLQGEKPKLQARSQPMGPHTALPFGWAAQDVPHFRQFCTSSSLRHAPLQGLKPSLQTMPQAPSVHAAAPLAGAGQALLQSLQCAGSVFMSTHSPPHAVSPFVQSLAHMPSTQTWLPMHGLLQPPQCAALRLVSTQAPSHSAKPLLQLAIHTPSVHNAVPLAGASQALPHILQFCGSALRSTQAPSHSSNPGLQAMPHSPSLQVALPLPGTGQAMPHFPQFCGLDVRSMQLPLQFVRSPAHVAPHKPSSHTWPGLHSFLQSPQRAGSFITFTHTPLPQSRNPSAHSTPHVLASHTATPPAEVGQACPQAPQLAASLVTSTQAEPQGV